MSLMLSKDEEDRARDLHNKSIIIDTLNSGPAVWTPQLFKLTKDFIAGGLDFFGPEMNKLIINELIENSEARQRYIEDIKASGVTAISTTLNTSMMGESPSFEGAVRDLAIRDSLISNLNEFLLKANSANDIRSAKKNGKLAIIYNFQDTAHLGYNLDNIDFFYTLGVRIIQLTYNMMNLVGVGTTEKYEQECGLSYFGVQFVERLNELGILVDTSHCGTKTTLDAVDVSKDPVVATHTACKAIYDYPRAKSDEALKAIAESGGYIGIYAVPFVYPAEDQTINHLLDEIDHAVDVAGVDHIGLGIDYGDQSGPWPDEIKEELHEAQKMKWVEIGFRPEHGIDPRLATEGIEVFRKWPNVTRGLVARGYSDHEIKKILGENFLRVFERVVG